LERVDLSDLACTIFEQTLASCNIEQAVALKVGVVERDGNGSLLLAGQGMIDLARFRHLRIIALGKAAPAMLEAFLPRLPLPPECDLAGVLISSLHPRNLPDHFEFFAGGHPMPNEASFAGARAVLRMLQAVSEFASRGEDTLSLFLVSGGASAMMELPLDAEISLADTILFNGALVYSGASIREINCVRKHFSAVKGGRLAIAAGGAECLSIFVSDVPSGHLDTIASGPTLPDTSTVEECHEIIHRYNLLDRFPESVRRFFASSTLPETPKPQELAAQTFTLLDANDLAEAARKQAGQFGFHAIIDNTCDDWDYRAAAEYLLGRLRDLRQENARVCLISVGEVAVPLPNSGTGNHYETSSVGGRNQHLALYTATLLQPSDEPIAVLSAGSDGVDGNSRAAGAVVSAQTLRAARVGVQSGDDTPDNYLHTEAQTALQQFGSYSFFQNAGGTIMTGPTGNNLRDLRILLAEPSIDSTRQGD
jgi:glycerate 2-kinase